ALVGVHGFEFELRRRQDPCDSQCNNILTALTSCTSFTDSYGCICPTVVPSAMACSSCLVSADADPTDAAIVASLYTICNSPTATTGPTSTTGGTAPASA